MYSAPPILYQQEPLVWGRQQTLRQNLAFKTHCNWSKSIVVFRLVEEKRPPSSPLSAAVLPRGLSGGGGARPLDHLELPLLPWLLDPTWSLVTVVGSSSSDDTSDFQVLFCSYIHCSQMLLLRPQTRALWKLIDFLPLANPMLTPSGTWVLTLLSWKLPPLRRDEAPPT